MKPISTPAIKQHDEQSSTTDVENEEYIDAIFSDYAGSDNDDELAGVHNVKLEIEHCYANVEAATLEADANAAADEENETSPTDDTLRFCMAPGKRYGSRLLYTLDEKQLYRRTNIFDKYDSYMCNAPAGSGCRVSLAVSKPQGIARKTGNYTKHNHGTREETYLENMAVEAQKIDLLADAGMDQLDKTEGIEYRDSFVDTITSYKRSVAQMSTPIVPIEDVAEKFSLPRLTSFHCDYCSASGMTRAVLLEHFRGVHGLMKLPCPTCSETFVT